MGNFTQYTDVMELFNYIILHYSNLFGFGFKVEDNLILSKTVRFLFIQLKKYRNLKSNATAQVDLE